MSWHALFYPLKPGSEDEVGELFASSGRPSFDVIGEGGQAAGRLLGTLAFVGKGKAIRVIEVDGDLRQVAAHMSRQPEVRAFEQRLESHLSQARDMTTPAGAQAFFRRAAMDSVRVVMSEQGGAGEWTGLYYPVKAGHEDAVKDLVTTATRTPDRTVRDAEGGKVGRLRGMMMFVGAQKALRLVQSDATRAEFMASIRDDPVAVGFQQRMTEHLSVERDLGSPESARRYFADATLRCVLSRRHDEDA